MIPLNVENRQSRYHPNLDRCRDLVHWMIRCSRRVLPPTAPPWGDVTLLLVGNPASASAHGTVFGREGATDVISLCYEPMPGLGLGISGELLVNVERAVAEGRRRSHRGWGPSHELALYIAHGIDHLTGADDALPADRRRMRAREIRWVRSAERAGLVRGLLRVREAPRPAFRATDKVRHG